MHLTDTQKVANEKKRRRGPGLSLVRRGEAGNTQTDRQTDRQTHTHTHTCTDTPRLTQKTPPTQTHTDTYTHSHPYIPSSKYRGDIGGRVGRPRQEVRGASGAC